MSDVVATYGLEYGDFRKGLAEIERTSARHFVTQQKASMRAAKAVGTAAKAFIGGNVIHTSFRLASAAITEFAERSPEAARAIGSIKKAGSDAAAVIGGDLFHALGLANGGWEEFIKGATGAYTASVNATAGILKGVGRVLTGDFSERDDWAEVEELDSARQADLDSQDVSRYQREDATRKLQSEADILDATGGDAAEVARLRERARNRHSLQQIGAIKHAPERETRRGREELQHQANMARIDREAKARDDAESEREAGSVRRMQMEQTLFGLEAKSLGIDELRARGRNAQADEWALSLEYARNEARIIGDASISEQDRAAQIDANNERRAYAFDILEQTVAMEREAAKSAIDDDLEMLGMRQMRLEGKAEEVAMLEIELARKKAIANVEKQESLSPEERAAATARINRAYDSLGSATRDATRDAANGGKSTDADANGFGSASIESGLGGRSGLRAQVFGPGGGGLEPMTREQKRANSLLERIERNTARGGAAVFA